MALAWFGQKSPSADAKAAAATTPGEDRKARRNERREQLYGVVRDAMTRAGVLTSSYKFKVLTLDSQGQNYLVMVDLVSSAKEDPGRLSEIEALITHNARVRHDLQVASVYWRLSNHVTSGLLNRPSPGAASPGDSTTPAALSSPGLDINEVLAFKQAFAAVPARELAASGQVLRSGPRGPQLDRGTVEQDLEEGVSPLGPTQFGELR
ncbi:MAG: hypothetical protein RLZZ126_678 [Pseudomonadota bacterium]|jgi:hypothetical protein